MEFRALRFQTEYAVIVLSKSTNHSLESKATASFRVTDCLDWFNDTAICRQCLICEISISRISKSMALCYSDSFACSATIARAPGRGLAAPPQERRGELGRRRQPSAALRLPRFADHLQRRQSRLAAAARGQFLSRSPPTWRERCDRCLPVAVGDERDLYGRGRGCHVAGNGASSVSRRKLQQPRVDFRRRRM